MTFDLLIYKPGMVTNHVFEANAFGNNFSATFCSLFNILLAEVASFNCAVLIPARGKFPTHEEYHALKAHAMAQPGTIRN